MAKIKDKVEDEVLTTQDDGVIDNAPEEDVKVDIIDDQTKDEEINNVGADAPTVEKPEPAPVPVIDPNAKVTADGMKQMRAAIVFLAKMSMTPADLQDFKTAFPGLL